MVKRSLLDIAQLKAFEQAYDITHEDISAQTRGQFLEAFPLHKLSNIKLEDYAIGHQRPTFCAHVEAKTHPWANIRGATSKKFGIYFGKTKSDPEKIYRFTHRFGDTKEEAFRSIKGALLSLIRLGKAPELDFDAIDANPLSQMFKAKILSLYFPDRFFNVCSAEHLELLGTELGYGEDRPISEYQHLLVQEKLSNRITQKWSNPKFMAFLYDTYVYPDRKPMAPTQKPPKKVAHPTINFEDVQNQRDAIGKAAEEFALEWEKQRLEGVGLSQLIPKIEDRRDRPGYGYDFLSHTAPRQRRYIEVKSVGKLPKGEGYRFFLSDNEHTVSLSAEHSRAYFFYLVFFNKNGQPDNLKPINAKELYQKSEMLPASYVVRFDSDRPGSDG